MFGFGKTIKGPEALLVDMIEHNADIIEKDEGKPRSEATYIAICLVIDDLMGRGPAGRNGYLAVMELLKTRYSQHMSDVVTYIAWSTGKITLTPEADAAMMARHQ